MRSPASLHCYRAWLQGRNLLEQGFTTPGRWYILVYRYKFLQIGELFCPSSIIHADMCPGWDLLCSLLMAVRQHGKRILCWLAILQWQMSSMIITKYWIITTLLPCFAAQELTLLFRLRSKFYCSQTPWFCAAPDNSDRNLALQMFFWKVQNNINMWKLYFILEKLAIECRCSVHLQEMWTTDQLSLMLLIYYPITISTV